jgi:hypothetical protein
MQTINTTPKVYRLSVYVAACPYLTSDKDTKETLKEQAIEALSYADKLTPVTKVLLEELDFFLK